MFNKQFIKVATIVKYACNKYLKLECHDRSPYAYLNRLFVKYDNNKEEMQFHYDINKNIWKVWFEGRYILENLSTYDLLYHVASNPTEDFSFGRITDFSAFTSDIFHIVSIELLVLLGKLNFRVDPYKSHDLSFHAMSKSCVTIYVVFDSGMWTFISKNIHTSIDHWNLSSNVLLRISYQE